MTEAPLLTHDAIRQELAQIHRRGHRTMTTALFARGEPGDVALKLFSGEEQRFEVVPVRCELELRRALSRRGEKALALLVDYPAERLPADVQGRLAGGRVYRIDRGRLLAQRFGASSVSAELLGCRPLCEALLSEPAAFERVLGTTVDLHTAWRTLLARWARIERDGDLTEDRLLAISATESPPRQAAALQPGTELGKALIEHLETVSGPIAPIAWRAWLAGRGVELAALTFLLDASLPALASDAGLRNALKIALRDVAPSLDPSAKSSLPLLQRWGGLAERLERRVPGPALDPILERAESFVPDPEMARRLADSRFLPCAFRATEEALAGALASFAKQPAAELVTQGKQELEQLGRHRLARSRDGLLSRARMALRLAAYLLTRPDLAEQASIHGSYGAVFTYAHHYVEEGSFVDHARDTARGPEETPLEQALGAVLERLDAQRDEDDTTFARACASWVAAGANDAGKVVPIAKGIDHFVVPFLKDAPHRKLLVVLLDGMSWANAVELLMDLEGHRYGLLRVADRTPRPMLAALPTLTGVSRSAFFAGKPIKTGEPQDTSKDPERFATHAGLRKIGIEGAELYLKDSVEGVSGDLSDKAMKLVRSSARLVGVVVNAIDDELKGTPQIRRPTTLSFIRPLARLLEIATEQNRAVLLVADHGHVRTSRMTHVGHPGDGRRYRYLSDADATDPREVVLGRDVAWVERGKTRVAMLARERDGYGLSAGIGEHGGLSLSEVVTPAILIGFDQLRRQVELAEGGTDDRELEIRPLGRPLWWDLELPKKRKAVSSPPPKSVRPTKAAPTQGVLFSAPPEAQAAPAKPSVEEDSALLRRLKALKIFGGRSADDKKRFLEVVAPRVELLHRAGGALAAEVFANRAGVLPRSVGGAVSEMGEWINFDQYLIVEHDPISKRVLLDIEKLEAYLKELER